MTEQTPTYTPVAKPKASRDRSTQVLLVLASLVAVAGLAFAGGRFTAPGTANAANPNSSFGAGRFGARGSFNPGQFAGRGGGGLNGGVEGTVESVNGSTMTIKLANGTTATVDLSGTTTYHSETAATSADVKSGSQVLVTIDTAAAAQNGAQPAPGASGNPGTRTFTAKDIILVTP